MSSAAERLETDKDILKMLKDLNCADELDLDQSIKDLDDYLTIKEKQKTAKTDVEKLILQYAESKIVFSDRMTGELKNKFEKKIRMLEQKYLEDMAAKNKGQIFLVGGKLNRTNRMVDKTPELLTIEGEKYRRMGRNVSGGIVYEFISEN